MLNSIVGVEDIHALVRELITIQATLSSIAVTVLIFLLPVLQKQSKDTLDNIVQNKPEDAEGVQAQFESMYSIRFRQNVVYFTAVSFPLIPVFATAWYLNVRDAERLNLIITALCVAFVLSIGWLVFVVGREV